MLRYLGFLLLALCALAAEPPPGKPIAVLIADWFPNSHPEVIVGRVLKTYTMDGKGRPSQLRVATIYRDLPSQRDMSADYAKLYGFEVVDSVDKAMTRGGDTLAVEGVILSTEWAPYPKAEDGQMQFPHRRLFDEAVAAMKRCNKMVPVFIDKHLADTWEDSLHIVTTARELGIPLMAGSSVPMTWRRPAADVDPSRKLKQIVGVSYHTLDSYGFHGMEMVQTLAERRQGGETGIAAVQTLTGDAVWEAAGTVYEAELLAAALARQTREMKPGKTVRDFVKEPVLFAMDYTDGLRVCLLTLNGWVREWSAAWRYEGAPEVESSLFWLEEQNRTYMHFATQLAGIEAMILTGKPAWPVERTLMTSGALDALLQSKLHEGKRLETPWLKFAYQSEWVWSQPPDWETGYRSGAAKP